MNKRTVVVSSRENPIKLCVHCSSEHIIRYGHQKNRRQRYYCNRCSKTFNKRHGTMFFHKKTSESKILKIVYLFLTGYPMEPMVPFFHLTEKTIRSILNDAIMHFSQIQDLKPKPEDYAPRVIMIDEIHVKLKGKQGFYGWLAYDPENRYIIAFQLGARDDETLEKLFRKLRNYRKKIELVVIDGYQGYEEMIKKHLSGKGKHQRPTVGVINKSRYDEKSNKFYAHVLWGENPRKAERLMRKFGVGTEITTALIERINGFVRDALAYMRRRTRRMAGSLEWVEKALTGITIFHNCVKAHWALSVRTSENWIKKSVTPAMRIGITEKQMSLRELLGYRILPTPM